MGKHKDLQDIILNELAIEEERAFRANRIIQHQEKLIANLERLLSISSETKKNVDTDDRKEQTDRSEVELLIHDSSSYATFILENEDVGKSIRSSESPEKSVSFHKKRKSRKMRKRSKAVAKVFSCEIRRPSTSTSLIPEYTQSEKTGITANSKTTQSLQSLESLCEEKSQTRLAANAESKNQICRNEMKNASGENARVREDSMARLVGLLQPVVCQHQDESSRVIRSHQRTSHSIVTKPQVPNSKDILELFERIEIRLKHLQDDILNARRDVASDSSRVQVIQNQIENMRQESISTNDLMMRLLKLRTQLENSMNELNWKIKGNRKFQDDITRERWITARKYFTAEQAYFLLTSAED